MRAAHCDLFSGNHENEGRMHGSNFSVIDLAKTVYVIAARVERRAVPVVLDIRLDRDDGRKVTRGNRIAVFSKAVARGAEAGHFYDNLCCGDKRLDSFLTRMMFKPIHRIDRGYTNSIYSPLYKQLFARGGDGKEPGIAYVPLTYVDAFDAFRTILAADGIPVLAHPGQMDNYNAVPEWVEAGLRGIEVKHPDHGPLEEAKARVLAHQYDLLMTGGSDFHGFYGDKPSALGSQSLGIQSVEAIKEKIRLRK
jgi:hypothetical protein